MDELIGKEIVGYRIVSLLGGGGMGQIYLAESIGLSSKKAAVKVIKSNMFNSYTKELLKQEALRLVELIHGGIVQLYNYSEDSNNVYLIMEYVEGENLESYIRTKSGLIVENRICQFFEPILDAVGYAHKKGILHCDIKPANIMVCTDGQIKVLDFGIARAMDQQTTNDVVMFTPSYASPEQANGDKMDERSDIYSLGVLLHHMLTGNPPYDTTTLTEQQITHKVMSEPLPRLKTYYKYISEELQQIVDKATAKDPKDRYKSTAEFKKALHNAVYPHKYPMWMKIAAGFAACLLIGGLIWTWDYHRVKTYYYKDYTEQWGVPQGIGELSSSEHSHANRSYMFVYKKRKLLRVAHVNSRNKATVDGESERRERPIDQELFYRSDGTIDHIKVKNQFGRVLYVKSYNAKLNTMVYQYDDEHGTEHVISNSTVGYGEMFTSDSQKKGKISRFWIEYDENGYVTCEKFAGISNDQVSDENGIYGRKYERDSKGRVTAIRYIGIDGNPQPTKWGLGIKRFYYDDNDDCVKFTYHTIDEKPAYDAVDGTQVYLMEYDKYGNVVRTMCKDYEGNSVIIKMYGLSGSKKYYNDKGNLIRTECLDADGNLMFSNKQHFAYELTEFDENGFPTVNQWFNIDDTPVENADANPLYKTKYDDRGLLIECWFYNGEGQLKASLEGIAGVKYEYDSLGNETKRFFYDENRNPTVITDNSHGYASEYDDKGNIVKITVFDKDQSPIVTSNGYSIIKREYDKRGNWIKNSYYDVDGTTLVKDIKEGVAVTTWTFDEKGNLTEIQYFDETEQPCISNDKKYHKIVYTYDENGNDASERYYGTDGKLILVSGKAGYDYKCDRQGNCLERKPIGLNGALAKNYLISKSEYDEFGNTISNAYYDNNGPTTNMYNVHKYTYKYNTLGNKIEEAYYSTSGRLTVNSDNSVAKIVWEYDAKGNMVCTKYFGTDDQPSLYNNLYSVMKKEYDIYGNSIKDMYFDQYGQYTNPSVMPPVGIAEYDKYCRMISVTSQDGYGNNIKFKNDTWSTCRYEYDSRGNKISVSYYDENGNPTFCLDKYHRIRTAYNKLDQKESEQYFGNDENPMSYYGINIIKFKYDEKGRRIAESYYDSNGNPANCDGGHQNMSNVFDTDNGTNVVARVYRKQDGSKLFVKYWSNADEKWYYEQSGYKWKNDCQMFNDKMPMNLGKETKNLELSYMKFFNSKTCSIAFTVPSSYKSSDLPYYKARTEEWADYLSTLLSRQPDMKVTLKNRAGTVLYTFKLNGTLNLQY